MAQGIVGKKVGMTQIYTEDGTCLPVTVVRAGPCVVIGKCTPDKQGYSSVRVGFEPTDEKHTTQAERGVFAKAGLPPMKIVREFRIPEADVAKLNVGDAIRVDLFRKGQFVDVTGTTKGRGFAGVIKRWGMKGAARDAASTHEHHRHIGAIGARKTPGKVWKGKHLPGHYGVETVTIQNLHVVDIDLENNLILIHGAVPGHRDALVEINPAAKGKKDHAVGGSLGEEVEEKKKSGIKAKK